MRQITDIDELRGIQLGIMDRIHEFCIKHHVEYSLSSGTLLGAVRHGGYIPWDDDIDIYMPRESYNRFVKLWNNEIDNYQIIDKFHSKNYPYSFPKIVDNRTILIEKTFPNIEIGVWVDVFPVDGIPDNKIFRFFYFIVNRYLNKVMWNRNFNHSPKGLLYKFRYYTSKYCPISTISALKLRDFLLSSCKSSEYIMHLTEAGPYTLNKCFKRFLMSTYKDIPFENRTYKAMIGMNDYLFATYGDYMKLPSEDKRETHKFNAYIK